MKKLLQLGCLIFLSALSCSAQMIFNVQAGSSTLYEASGASATIYMPNSVTAVSVGDFSGHFLVSASEHTRMLGDDWYFGDHPISLTSGSTGLSVPLLGVDVERTNKEKMRKFSVFLGTVGQTYWVPYGFAAQPKNFGAGYSFEQTLGSFRVSSIGVMAGSQKTFIEGVNYRWKTHLNLVGDFGVLQNAPIVNGNANFFDHGFGANVAEQTLILNGKRADVTSESASYAFHFLDVRATNVEGHAGSLITSGQTAGVGVRLDGGAVGIRTDYYQTRGAPSSIVTTATEQLRHRYTLIESVSTSAGHETFNLGGGYVSNQFSASVTHNVLYYPELQNPWQQTLAVTVSIRVRDVSTTLGTLAQPNGGVKFVAYGGDYLYAQGAQSSAYHSVGKYEILGSVQTADGKGISGAAIKLNGTILYTDEDGKFSTRVGKDKSYPLSVVPAEFLEGNFKVTSAPDSAKPGTTILIIVARD